MKRLLLAAFWFGSIAICSAGIKLEGHFTVPQQSYFMGEPIYATFSVTNQGDAPIAFPTGGDYRSTGRHDRFQITATNAAGEALVDPVEHGGMGGGIGGDSVVQPGLIYTETLLVNHWRKFSAPGTYKITFKRTVNVHLATEAPSRRPAMEESQDPAFPIETTLVITVVDDPVRLKDYIATLGTDLHDAAEMRKLPPWKRAQKTYGKPSQTRNLQEELECLALAQNAVALPLFISMLDQPEAQASAVQWLGLYPENQAGPVLLDHFSKLSTQAKMLALSRLSDWNVPGVAPLLAAALQDKDPQLRANTVRLCWNKTPEGCLPILLAMGDDPDPLVRRYLGAALGSSGNPRAIPVLLKLLHDDDVEIPVWAADGLRKFKRYEGVPVLIELLRDPKAREYQGNIMQTLHDLTGRDFGDSPTAWFAWWEKSGRAQYGAK